MYKFPVETFDKVSISNSLKQHKNAEKLKSFQMLIFGNFFACKCLSITAEVKTLKELKEFEVSVQVWAMKAVDMPIKGSSLQAQLLLAEVKVLKTAELWI